MITLRSLEQGWVCEDVLVAETMRQRLLGVMRGPNRVLLRTRFVHGFGLPYAIKLVGIDAHGVVVRTSLLEPARLVSASSAHWVLELPLCDPLPEEGSRLSIYPQRSARQTHSLCDSNRQSR